MLPNPPSDLEPSKTQTLRIKTIKVTDRNKKNGYPTGFNAVKGKPGLGWWGMSREV
jgi:hypothetical protein